MEEQHSGEQEIRDVVDHPACHQDTPTRPHVVKLSCKHRPTTSHELVTLVNPVEKPSFHIILTWFKVEAFATLPHQVKGQQ